MHKKDTYNLAIGLALQELHNEQKPPREKIAQALELSELDVTRIEHGSETLSAGSLCCCSTFRRHLGRFRHRVRANLDKAEAQIR